jgi:undecaprenyl diphosphate synthase
MEKKMADTVGIAKLPRHVAIIMDGNGRWATMRHLPRKAGHVAGMNALREVVRQANDIGLENLTLYAFSTENWKRPPTEVGALMQLLRLYIRKDIAELCQRGVRLRFIGSRARADADICGLIEDAESRTATNTGLNLLIAFDYGSQQEIAAAARALAREAVEGRLDPAAITPEMLSRRLFTAGLPEPDLIVRTSGVLRLSNFFLWQAVYAELLFVDTLWPDFGAKEFMAALEEFARRERRFGALPESVA